MSSGERRPRIGRPVLFQQGQRHTPMRNFIPEAIPSGSGFIRNIAEVMYFQDLVGTIRNMASGTVRVPASLHSSTSAGSFDD